MLLSSSVADFFQNKLFQKNISRTLSVPNSLDSDQDRRIIGPDLGPNCLQSLSVDNKSYSLQRKS